MVLKAALFLLCRVMLTPLWEFERQRGLPCNAQIFGSKEQVSLECATAANKSSEASA